MTRILEKLFSLRESIKIKINLLKFRKTHKNYPLEIPCFGVINVFVNKGHENA